MKTINRNVLQHQDVLLYLIFICTPTALYTYFPDQPRCCDRWVTENKAPAGQYLNPTVMP